MDFFTAPFHSHPVVRTGVGCEQLGGTDWGDYDYRDGVAAIKAALEHGINLFDTANVYGLGLSEQRLGQALGAQRHDVCVVTKGGFRWDDSSGGQRAQTRLDLSPASIRASIDESLQRLRLDSIPLFLVHWPSPEMQLEPLIEALAQERDAGKIKGFGLSNFSLEQLEQACTVARIDAIEFEYNLLDVSAAENLLEFAKRQDIRTLAYGALGQGLLTGKYDRHTTFPESDRRHRLKHFNADNLPRNLEIVERVKVVANELQLQPSQVAIQWCLESATLDAVVVGVKNTRQLDHLVAIEPGRLGPDRCAFLAGESASHYRPK